MALRAAIYDLDGLAIDSEPCWIEAEISVMGELGVPLTPAIARETTGTRLDEAVALWARRFTWHGASLAQVRERIISRATSLILARAPAKPGLRESLRVMADAGLRCAMASSSPVTLIRAVLEKLGLTSAFEVVTSGESEPLGKPHPGVYLTAAARLGVESSRCVALEDSLNGVVAAKAARMRCIAVPDDWAEQDPRLVLADATIRSLHDVDRALLDRLG
jgi:mannitol-1-/sugar-/sorbitol-6-/2-deoxyglucose-6-phosphatase